MLRAGKRSRGDANGNSRGRGPPRAEPTKTAGAHAKRLHCARLPEGLDSHQGTMAELSQRARQILYVVVTEYVATGLPVGSRTISKKSDLDLSPASIRNVLC